jgi:hypothetical protein
MRAQGSGASEGDGGSGRGERTGGRQAHTGAGAGDEGDLAGEVVRGIHVVVSIRVRTLR